MKTVLFKWRGWWSWPTIAAGLLMALVASYSWSRTRDLLRGPELTIAPIDAARLDSPLLGLEGEVRRVAHLQLNDGKIFADAAGHFSQKLLLYPGYNIIKLEATDRFGRRAARYIELAYREPVK